MHTQGIGGRERVLLLYGGGVLLFLLTYGQVSAQQSLGVDPTGHS